LWSEANQIRELARREPWKPAALVKPTKCEAPIASKAVPAQRGLVERFPAHGFHRIPKDRCNLSNLYLHFPSFALQ
jgi:hypothetical protein